MGELFLAAWADHGPLAAFIVVLLVAIAALARRNAQLQDARVQDLRELPELVRMSADDYQALVALLTEMKHGQHRTHDDLRRLLDLMK